MMNRPHVILHMVTSLDGKVTGNYLTSAECEKATELYYQINRDYQADAYACGRITMEGSFTNGWYPDLTQYPEVTPAPDPTDFLPGPMTGFYAVAFDPHGRLGWKHNQIVDEDPGYGGAQIIEVLTEQADARYLGYLKAMKIPYIFAGKTEIDITAALIKLKNIFGIQTLLLEGGSILNGAFQRVGLIDELSLVLAPLVAEANDKSLFADSILEGYTLADIKNHDGILHMNYRRNTL